MGSSSLTQPPGKGSSYGTAVSLCRITRVPKIARVLGLAGLVDSANEQLR